jgi:hypothetical protein
VHDQLSFKKSGEMESMNFLFPARNPLHPNIQ